MGSDKRIPCSETVFSNLRDQKQEKGLEWDEYLQWLFAHANDDGRYEDDDDVDLTPVLNRIDDLESQLPRKLKEELSR